MQEKIAIPENRSNAQKAEKALFSFLREEFPQYYSQTNEQLISSLKKEGWQLGRFDLTKIAERFNADFNLKSTADRNINFELLKAELRTLQNLLELPIKTEMLAEAEGWAELNHHVINSKVDDGVSVIRPTTKHSPANNSAPTFKHNGIKGNTWLEHTHPEFHKPEHETI
jgi:hypothetical protein